MPTEHRDLAGGSALKATERSTLRRRPGLGRLDRATVHAIIDECLVCHVGFVEEGDPVVVPASPWRIGDWLYLHGAANSRLLARARSGMPLCVSLALVDGVVLARAALRHSLHFRSVVLFGRGEPVADPAAKEAALRALIDKLAPGRAARVRPPAPEELAATAVARLRIEEGNAKMATQAPSSTPDDDGWPVWAGVVPLSMSAGAPCATPDSAGLAAPAMPRWLAGAGGGWRVLTPL